ncbi:MAG: MBL fold metallo-hydrolase, partial [Cyclobacteriaceae bacterium]|nr:MBL fold metallo-hydrolase [Cyclobacteriaceae bacterium]
DEIMEAGISHENAEKIFATKLHYSGGEIKSIQELVASCVIGEEEMEIKNNVFIHRTGINIFKISYKDEAVSVDLNLQPNEHFLAPYELPFREINPEIFSITHSGEGNGWDKDRPCMASIIHHQDRIYLIDAGPNILNNLSYLGIGLSEIDGIFLSHIHDDHFAGITELLNVERKLNLYTTKLIRRTAEKKLKALINSEIDLINVAFNCIDLEFNKWNEIKGLQVQPIYSPHTVETNIFNFRVFDGKEYRTYAHLSDTINFNEYKDIIDKSPDIFTRKDITYLEHSYLTKVDLKKIDVGGGPIHGHLSDYANDNSDLVVLAHTSAPLESDRENLINVSFGDTHTLIQKENFNLLKTKSLRFIKHYFNTLDDEQI